MYIYIVLFVRFCCGYEQIIQFCSGIDICVRIEMGKVGRVTELEQTGESVSWEKSRSVIQLCARQEENKEEERRKGRSQEEERKKNAVNT